MKLNDNVSVLDGQLFDWAKGIGYAAASELPEGWAKRVWVASPLEGFYVRSHKTGQRMLFVAAAEPVRDSGGDILAWVFTSEDGKVSIEVFND